MNAKHQASEASASKSDSDVLAELCALLQSKVTDAPPLTRDNVVKVVSGVLAALVQRNTELGQARDDSARLADYCETLHAFIKKGGV